MEQGRNETSEFSLAVKGWGDKQMITMQRVVLLKYLTKILRLRNMLKDSALRVELLKMMLPKN